MKREQAYEEAVYLYASGDILRQGNNSAEADKLKRFRAQCAQFLVDL